MNPVTRVVGRRCRAALIFGQRGSSAPPRCGLHVMIVRDSSAGILQKESKFFVASVTFV